MSKKPHISPHRQGEPRFPKDKSREPGEVKIYHMTPEEIARLYGSGDAAPTAKVRPINTYQRMSKTDILTQLIAGKDIGKIAFASHIDLEVLQAMVKAFGLELDENGRLKEESKEMSMMDDARAEWPKEKFEVIIQGKTEREIIAATGLKNWVVRALKAEYGLTKFSQPQGTSENLGTPIAVIKDVEVVGYASDQETSDSEEQEKRAEELRERLEKIEHFERLQERLRKEAEAEEKVLAGPEQQPQGEWLPGGFEWHDDYQYPREMAIRVDRDCIYVLAAAGEKFIANASQGLDGFWLAKIGFSSGAIAIRPVAPGEKGLKVRKSNTLIQESTALTISCKRLLAKLDWDLPVKLPAGWDEGNKMLVGEFSRAKGGIA